MKPSKSKIPFLFFLQKGRMCGIVILVFTCDDIGDVYFKIRRRNHNLDRCRTQLALVKSIEKQFDKMRKLADTI